jgi:hypothetical protein
MNSVRIVAILCAIVTLTACGGDSTAPQATIFGTYTLRSVGGAALPARVITNGITITDQAGSVTFNSNGTFSETLTATGASGPTSLTLSGTFAVSGNSLAMAFSANGGFTDTGSWSGNTVNVNDSGYLFVFTK